MLGTGTIVLDKDGTVTERAAMLALGQSGLPLLFF